MASIPSSSKAVLLPLIMATATSKSPPKPKSPPTTDAIEIVQNFIDKHPDYKVAYGFIEEVVENEKEYQFFYQMGERVLARGDFMAKKKEAKRSAAQRTECALRREGYELCGNSSKQRPRS